MITRKTSTGSRWPGRSGYLRTSKTQSGKRRPVYPSEYASSGRDTEPMHPVPRGCDRITSSGPAHSRPLAPIAACFVSADGTARYSGLRCSIFQNCKLPSCPACQHSCGGTYFCPARLEHSPNPVLWRVPSRCFLASKRPISSTAPLSPRIPRLESDHGGP